MYLNAQMPIGVVLGKDLQKPKTGKYEKAASSLHLAAVAPSMCFSVFLKKQKLIFFIVARCILFVFFLILD